MPPTTSSDNWEHTLTSILRYDSKSETGRSLRFWVEHHKLEQWDMEEHKSWSIELTYGKTNCEKSMPSTPLR